MRHSPEAEGAWAPRPLWSSLELFFVSFSYLDQFVLGLYFWFFFEYFLLAEFDCHYQSE